MDFIFASTEVFIYKNFRLRCLFFEFQEAGLKFKKKEKKLLIFWISRSWLRLKFLFIKTSGWRKSKKITASWNSKKMKFAKQAKKIKPTCQIVQLERPCSFFKKQGRCFAANFFFFEFQEAGCFFLKIFLLLEIQKKRNLRIFSLKKKPANKKKKKFKK